MLVVKVARQKHHASPDLLRLLDEFRHMVNICLARKIAAGGLRFSPNRPPGEAMVEEGEPGT
jgi:hypothetical protein